MWLVRLAISNPYLVAAFSIMLTVLGVLSAFAIPVDILPVFKAPAVQVLRPSKRRLPTELNAGSTKLLVPDSLSLVLSRVSAW